MATSGTIGNTTIPTNQLLEKAIRRVGLLPQAITPEIVSTALEDLFLLIMSLSSRGLNLWCVDEKFISLEAGKQTYVLPTGTIDVLNLLHCTPKRADGSVSINGTTVTANLTGAETVSVWGFKSSTTLTTNTLQGSDDGLTWTTLQTVTPTAEGWNWFTLPQAATYSNFQVTGGSISADSDLYISTGVTEIAVSQFNRDDYANQPNKSFQSGMVTNFYFEKLVQPQLTTWPVPNSDEKFLRLFRYRQIQDVGDLTNELELPARWLEAITWHLALRLAFELPNVDGQRRNEVAQMASSFTIEAEGGETDNAPIYLRPNIAVYTR